MPEVLCTKLHPDVTVVRAASLHEAERLTGVSRNSIVRRIITGSLSYKGWLFDWGEDPKGEGALIEARFLARRASENRRRRDRRRSYGRQRC